MNPFDVLGLTGAAPTRAEVRRAYAALLRRHRPDDDPAGFRRVRDAYEALAGLGDAALAQLAFRARRDGDDATAAAPEGLDADDRTPFDRTGGADARWPVARPTAASPPAAPSRPEAEPEALDSLEADLRARLDAATSAAERIEIVRGVMPTVEHDPALARATAMVVAAADPSEGRTLAAAATPTFATALLASGDEATVTDLSAQWNRPEHWPDLIEWAQRADDHVPPIPALASPEALVALAREVAVLLPHTALHLADEAFLHAPPDRRTALPLADVDRWAAASIAVGDDPGGARRGLALWAKWRVVSDDPREFAELEALEQRLASALEAIDRGMGTDEHRQLIGCVEEVAEQQLSHVRARRLDILAKLRRIRRQAPTEARRRSIALWLVVPVLLVVTMHTLSRSFAPAPRSRPSELESIQELTDRIGRTLPPIVPPPPRAKEPPPDWKPLTPVEEQELEALRGLPAPLTDERLRRRRDDLEYRASFTRRR